MSGLRLIFLVLVFAGLFSTAANSHALDPGYLELSPLDGEPYRVFWRKPDVQGRPMDIEAQLPEACDLRYAPSIQFDGLAWVAEWITHCPDGLAGGEIRIDGLQWTETDTLVRYPSQDGSIHSIRLTPVQPGFVVTGNPGAYDVFKSYFPLGTEHILGGIDHLLFVFALILLIRQNWRLVGAITAFTIAHSITMAAATLGWVSVPSPPVEAVIALSIMFVASELLRSGSGDRLSERYPWMVSFAFGLLHGFGFAGALREIGIPETDIPLALFSFNLGVEIGQIAFVLLIVALRQIWKLYAPLGPKALLRDDHAVTWSAYAIGCLSAYWFVERTSAFF